MSEIFTITVSREIEEKMRRLGMKNWSKVAGNAVPDKLRELEDVDGS